MSEAKSALFQKLEESHCWECWREVPAKDRYICPTCGKLFCPRCQETHTCVTSSQKTSPKSDPKPVTESPLYHLLKQLLCDECGIPVSATERYTCPVCGKILCQFCRKEHACETSPLKTTPISQSVPTPSPSEEIGEAAKSVASEAAAIPAAQELEEAVQYRAKMRVAQNVKDKPASQPVKPTPPKSVPASKPLIKYLYCDDCGRAYPESELTKCEKCGKIYCKYCEKKHHCTASGLPSKSAPEPLSKYEWCDGCGGAFPPASLRRCNKCGKIYCRNCQKKHHCTSISLPKITWPKRSQKPDPLYVSSRSKTRSSRPVVKALGQFLWGFFRIPLTILLIVGVVALGTVLFSPSADNPSPIVFPTPSPTPTPNIYPHITYNTSSYIATTIQHDFTYQNYPFRISLTTNKEIYNAARTPESKKAFDDTSISRSQWNTNYYRAYIDDKSQQSFISQLSQQFQNIQDTHQFDSDEYIELVTAYVQSIPYYTEDGDAKYPIETFVEHFGDCDDKSILLAALLADAGYDVALLDFSQENHMTVGIAVESQYAYAGTGHYAIIETTDYWLVSEIPDEVTTIPAVIPIGGGTKTYTAAYQVDHILQKWNLADQRIQYLRYANSEADKREYYRAVDHYNLLTGLNSHPDREYIYQKMAGYY